MTVRIMVIAAAVSQLYLSRSYSRLGCLRGFVRLTAPFLWPVAFLVGRGAGDLWYVRPQLVEG
jgi:hypothetical protein